MINPMLSVHFMRLAEETSVAALQFIMKGNQQTHMKMTCLKVADNAANTVALLYT
jgi:hypothetical protein